MTLNPRGEINPKALTINLACVGTLLMSVIVATLWINNTLNRIDRRLERLEESANNQWTVPDMSDWTTRYGAMNPGSKIPYPSDVVRSRIAQ
jgi:hypothetical protein